MSKPINPSAFCITLSAYWSFWGRRKVWVKPLKQELIKQELRQDREHRCFQVRSFEPPYKQNITEKIFPQPLLVSKAQKIIDK